MAHIWDKFYKVDKRIPGNMGEWHRLVNRKGNYGVSSSEVWIE